MNDWLIYPAFTLVLFVGYTFGGVTVLSRERKKMRNLAVRHDKLAAALELERTAYLRMAFCAYPAGLMLKNTEGHFVTCTSPREAAVQLWGPEWAELFPEPIPERTGGSLDIE